MPFRSSLVLGVLLISLLLISKDVAAARDHFTETTNESGDVKKNVKPVNGAVVNDEKWGHGYYGGGGYGGGYDGGYGGGYGGYMPGHGWYGGGYGNGRGYGGGGGGYGGYGGGGGYGGYSGGGGYGGGGYGGGGYMGAGHH